MNKLLRTLQRSKSVITPSNLTTLRGNRKFKIWRSVTIRELSPSDPQRRSRSAHTTVIKLASEHATSSGPRVSASVVVPFIPLTPTSSGEIPPGRGAWDGPHSHWCNRGIHGGRCKGAFRRAWFPQIYPGGYLHHLRRPQSSPAISTHNLLFTLIYLQETVTVRNKIEDQLSRVITLEQLFATPPGDIVEQRCRNELIRYANVPSLTLR